MNEQTSTATSHKGRYVYSGPEYGDVWECDEDCPHPEHDENGRNTP